MNKLFYFLCVSLCFQMVTAQNLRVEPPHWFAGMKSQQLQLLVHAENIKDAEIKLNSDRVKLLQVHKADSPNYLFLDLELAQTSKAYSFKINFEFKNQKNLSYKYRIKKRLKAADNYEGFDSSDAIYLITPDRFANGNPSNDVIKGMNETKIDRADTYARHGGDIEGIIQHLNYISDMGFTAIWPSPLLENNMHYGSYHGYAMTDFYKVDPRFGDLKSYQK
ncbi:MAG: cyclomaltodextrinase N-terminal domain-containing protein, partial [Psychroflexus sp.]